MSPLVISLPEDRRRKLEAITQRYGLEPEELVRASIADLITRPNEDFRRALEFVLN